VFECVCVLVIVVEGVGVCTCECVYVYMACPIAYRLVCIICMSLCQLLMRTRRKCVS